MSKFLLALFILPLSLCAATYELSICAIFQDDASYLKEWIEFHKLQGVQHFYLYNNNSRDHYLDILTPYITQGDVTLIEWDYKYEEGNRQDWCSVQTGAYLDCVCQYENETKWLALLDTDEFLFCPDGQPLPEFLLAYEPFPAVCVNWLMFGTSFVENIPEGDLLIEHLVLCADYLNPSNQHVKSIVQPKFVTDCYNAHFCIYGDDLFAVNADFQKVMGPFSEPICLDKIRINHYWTRTERFLNEIKIPRKWHMRGTSEKRIRRDADAYNYRVDTAILQFVERLKAKMAFSVPTKCWQPAGKDLPDPADQNAAENLL